MKERDASASETGGKDDRVRVPGEKLVSGSEFERVMLYRLPLSDEAGVKLCA